MTRRTLPGKIRRLLYKNIDWENQHYGYDHSAEIADTEDAELVSSEVGRGMHAPVLDLDFNAALVPSSTPGHYHLYLDHKITWDKYLKLLHALEEAEILEPGWVAAAESNGYTGVRVPWLKKENTGEDFF